MQYRIKQTMFGENQLCVLHQSKRKINLRYQKYRGSQLFLLKIKIFNFNSFQVLSIEIDKEIFNLNIDNQID